MLIPQKRHALRAYWNRFATQILRIHVYIPEVTPTNGTSLRSIGYHFHIPESQINTPTRTLAFWLLLVGWSNVFTVRPCDSVGFPFPSRETLSYHILIVVLFDLKDIVAHHTIVYLRVRRSYS
jgi:hypothetical protein